MSSELTGFQKDIVWGIGQGVFRRMDIVVGAVDNRLARYFINKNCSMFEIPFIDSAIQELNGTVSVYKTPETACYECTLYEDDYKLLTEKYPCFGLLSEEIVEWKKCNKCGFLRCLSTTTQGKARFPSIKSVRRNNS